MANWTPDSMIGDMFRVVGRHVPPPQGVHPAVAWGDPERVAALLGPRCRDLRTSRQTFAWRFPSPQACLEHFRTWYGPTVAAFRAVGDAGRESLEGELVDLFTRHSTAADGTMAAEVAYLQVVAVRDQEPAGRT